MKRFITYKKKGNIFTILFQLENGLADLTGNPQNFDTYKDYVDAGFLGNKKVFDFVKTGGIVENISNSNYIKIVDNIPIWKEGIETELLQNLNLEIKIQRQLRYAQECDILTNELKRRELINDLTEDEKQLLINGLTKKSNNIKKELPYYTEIILK